MHTYSYTDLLPLFAICMTLWLMRARFTSPIDTPWALGYYVFLVLFVRYNELDFNNYFIFGGVICGLFLRFEFMAGAILKFFRTGEFGHACVCSGGMLFDADGGVRVPAPRHIAERSGNAETDFLRRRCRDAAERQGRESTA